MNADRKEGKQKSTNQARTPSSRTYHYHATLNTIKCKLCKGDHPLYTCRTFLQKGIYQRNEYAKENKLCINCLRPGHFTQTCMSTRRCQKCNRKHHTSVHFDQNPENPRQSMAVERTTQSGRLQSHNCTTGSSVLLATAVIKINGPNNNIQCVRALIDQGSQASFITEDVANKLQLQKTKVDVTVSGLGSHEVSRVKYKVNITLSNNPKICTTAYVLKNVTKTLPSTRIKTEWGHLQKLILADPTYNIPGKIDMIVGAEVIAEILQEGVIKGKPGSPIAQQTIFGWIISGNTGNNTQQLSCHITLTDLDNRISKFWNTEDLRNETQESQTNKCEDYYQQTVSRNKEGRYVVRIPFEVQPELSNNQSKKRAIA
ncbi:uncharacterized protein LOC129918280 [Episyrphus balteatus]|uniref:uncharacterized protein LOC129918280 n=1 Tax=Episyrphus balteatus TaxID=286459 RepID=UPI00248685BE|nr:uncharacterized protein LOC129918280 [Episyrphus balteatus]